MTIKKSASIDSIIQGLYLGSLMAAQSLDRRPELGITHVLSVCPDSLALPDGTIRLTIPVQDSEYEDLLIHLPNACRFIQSALDQGGKVLVHCLMGVSRSATVVCAYLMWSRRFSVVKALAFVKKRRTQIHPNYGFMKQLDAFSAFDYDPSPSNCAYRAWKRRCKQDVTHFLNAVSDTTAIIPDRLYMSNEFPDDLQAAEALLYNMGVTHIVSLSPAQLELPNNVMNSIIHRHINIPTYRPESVILALSEICDFIHDAINSGGQVLVYCVIESRACIVVTAYLMYSREISAAEALATIEDVLPLFNPSAAFQKQLEVFEACQFKPTPYHPLVRAWVEDVIQRQT